MTTATRKGSKAVAERPTLDLSHAVESPRSFAVLANGGKLEGESLAGIVSIAADGAAAEYVGRLGQAVSAYVWTGSKTGTMAEWSEAVGIRHNPSNASQLSAAGKALVTIDLPDGITAQMVLTAATMHSKAIREASSKTALGKAVRAALAAKNAGRKAQPPTGTDKGLSVTDDEATPESSKTPTVTSGDPASVQATVKSVIDGLVALTSEPRKIRTADVALLRNAIAQFEAAVSADRNNRTAAAH